MWDLASDAVRVVDGLSPNADANAKTALTTRAACLEQLIEAFNDIANRDDIHQAAHRLALVQAWINHETARAAADPIFSTLLLT